MRDGEDCHRDDCNEDVADGMDAAGVMDSAKLFRLADFERDTPARIVNELRAYWNSLRKGRAIPVRSDVEPRGIHRALDYAFILERIAPGAARFRLAGRHLIDLMGMEVRGMPLCALVNSSSRGRLSDVLESVFRAPQLAELQLYSHAEYARPEMTGRMLLLPLKSDLGDVTRALGCMISEGDPGVAPRRFDLVGDQVMPIIEGGATMEPSPSAIGLVDESAPLAGKTRRKRQVDRAPITLASQNDGQAASQRPPATGTHGAEPQQPPPPDSPEARRAMFRVIEAGGER